MSRTRLFAYGFCLLVSLGIVALLLFSATYLEKQYEVTLDKGGLVETNAPAASLFPVGVDPIAMTITEQPNLAEFMTNTLAIDVPVRNKSSIFEKLERVLVQSGFYQQLASPTTRILVIWAGERQEEVTDNFARILGWSEAEEVLFLQTVNKLFDVKISEGLLYPDRYVVTLPASPETVAQMIHSRFIQNITDRYPAGIEDTLPLSDTLIVASLLEREAYSFEHMRLIAGVVWNRLFIDMPLQIDATLQYARASANNSTWWPVPVPSDKWIDSPFNTYQNEGLPPAPIASPGTLAVVAALNPLKTDCLFYFHADNGDMYCSETYEQHVASLVEIFGQGR